MGVLALTVAMAFVFRPLKCIIAQVLGFGKREFEKLETARQGCRALLLQKWAGLRDARCASPTAVRKFFYCKAERFVCSDGLMVER